MSWTLCASGAAIAKAGANCNADIKASGAILSDWCDKAESEVCMKTRKDWITGYADVQTNLKPVLADAVSDMIAIKMINYDMAGYLKGEAQTMLDVLDNNFNTIIKDLREDANQKLNK